MNLASLIAPLEAMQISWPWFKVLLIATFFLHLLVMNLMLGNAILALWIKDRNQGEVVAANLPYTIAFAVNLGVAPLLFLQVIYGNLIYTSSILMAVFWFWLIGLLIAAYYSMYLHKKFGDTKKIFLYFGIVAFLIIAFLFTNNMTLMVQPARWVEYFSNPEGTILNLGDVSVYPRFLHFVMASVAIAGLSQAIWFRRDEGKRGFGFKAFIVATVVQVFVGFLFLIALPREILFQFMGDNIVGTLHLVIAMLLTLLSLLFAFKQKLVATTVTTLLTVLVMIVVRDFLRGFYLKGLVDLNKLKVVPQYSPLIFFLVMLVIGTAAVVYMIKLANQKEER